MGIIAEAWRAERRRDMGFVPIFVGEHRLSFSSSLDALRIVVYRWYVGQGKGSSGIDLASPMTRLHLLCMALAILFLGVLHAGERHMRAVGRSDDCWPGDSWKGA